MSVLIMLLVGWIVVLPAVVVTGLYVSATVFGRRAARRSSHDLLVDEPVAEPRLHTVACEATGETITSAAAARPDRCAAPDPAPVREQRPAGARY